MYSIYSLLLLIIFLSACSGENNEQKPAPVIIDNSIGIMPTPSNNLAIPDNRFANDYQILVFGNSHVAGLGDLIKTLIRTGNPFATININTAGGGFLDDTSSRSIRMGLVENRLWTHVILQGQKYSQSGIRTYPTDAAVSWIAMAKNNNITPILFPEHPQRGKTQEAASVQEIHAGIAEIQKSCVAPVGLAWDKVIITEPQLTLHSNDGNHAALMGKLLTAYIFYEVITGEVADILPFIAEIDVDQATQQILRQFASETIQAHQPCLFGI